MILIGTICNVLLNVKTQSKILLMQDDLETVGDNGIRILLKSLFDIFYSSHITMTILLKTDIKLSPSSNI